MISKNIKEELKAYFFRHSTKKLHLRGIERATKLSFPLIVRYTHELINESILKEEIFADRKVFSANRSSDNYLLEKKLFNIKQLYISGLVNYLEKTYHKPPMVVFGSFIKGEDIEKSDIDIFIETPSKVIPNFKKFEKKLYRKIQIFKNKDIKSILNKHLINNIINGFTIKGYLEVI